MPGRMAERIGEASGREVGEYIMSRDNVKQAIASVTNAAKWISAGGEKVNRILAPFADLADKADGAGGLIRAILAAWRSAREATHDAATETARRGG